MSDRPYTDDDLRAEAARQHRTATTDPDFMGIGEQMGDRFVRYEVVDAEHGDLMPPPGTPRWDDLNEDEFDEAQRKIHDLINGAADVSAWAVDIGADGLEPLDSVLSMQATAGSLARIYFAVRPDMPAAVRTALVEGIGTEIAKFLPDARNTEVTIPMETAAHVLWQDRLGGWPPSTFATKLLSLWTSADTDNADRLAVAFPDYAAALDLLRSGQQGIEQLRAIADDS